MKRAQLLTTALLLILLSIRATAQDLDARAPLSADLNLDSRATYKALAQRAGLNVVFARNFAAKPAEPFRVENKTPAEAFDQLAKQTATFWQSLNKNTILVVEDSVQNRREYEAHIAETIYLPIETTEARIYEIVNALQTRLAFRSAFRAESVRAIVIHDTPARLLQAESTIAEMSGAPLRKKQITDFRTVFSENGKYFHTAASDRDLLQVRTKEPIAFASTASSRDAFEKLAAVAGLQVLFGPAFRPQAVDFSVQGVDAIEALDFLALHSGAFWRRLDARTILVMDDMQLYRNDFDPHVIETVYVPREISTNGVYEIINILRTAFLFRGIAEAVQQKAYVIHDIPQRVALAKTVIDQLNPFSTPATSVQIPAPRFARTAIIGIAPSARSELSAATLAPVSINLNQDTRATYEALADVAGLKVNFSADFKPGSTQQFRLEGVDPLDAIDYFSLVTQNAWKVVDNQTILVFPDNQLNRSALETQIAKTFHLTSIKTANATRGMLDALRTSLTFGNKGQSADGIITLQDTPQRMMIAEKVFESLDRPPLAPANPEIATLQVVLSAYRGDTRLRTETHSLDVEIGAPRATLRLARTIPVQINGNATQQQVGVSIDSEILPLGNGRYKVTLTTTTRDAHGENQTNPTFRNFVATGPLILPNGGTAEISGADIVHDEILRTTVSLSVKNVTGLYQGLPSSLAQPTAVPIKLQFVVSRNEGNKRITQPYMLITSSGGTSSLRIGSEILLDTPFPNGQTRMIFQQFGATVDARVTPADDGRFRLEHTVTGRYFSNGEIRGFQQASTPNAPGAALSDGQSVSYTVKDDKGEDVTIDIVLTVLK